MELSLDLSLSFVPITISQFLGDVSRSRDMSEKLRMLDDFVRRLEAEMRKIDAFKRELPLCMLLVNDAIARLKEETVRCLGKQDLRMVEEFIPLKTNSAENGELCLGKEKDSCDKKNWMSSAQLWSTESKLRSEDNDLSLPENPIKAQNQKNREGTFIPLNNDNLCFTKAVKEDKEVSQVPSLSLMTTIASELNQSNSEGRIEMKSQPQQLHLQQNSRKQRRCWSPELHRRFVDALQQLGGAQVATPKQIRELMQVEGLTNDEVKSHLQKYRLHVRRHPDSSAGQTNGLWTAQDQFGDKAKESFSQQSGSPQGPLLLGSSGRGLSSSGRNSMDKEEDEDSDCRSWKGGLRHHRAEADVLS